MRKVVSNTTPLIALADIGQLELLHKLYGEIMIPEAVFDEVESEPAKTMVSNAEWIKKIKVLHPDKKSLFSSRLHAGEIEAIILAEEERAELLLMDDNAAKKTAKYLGFHVTGSLGVLVKAKQNGYIENVEKYLNLLIDDGLYVDMKTRAMVLKLAGEQ